MGTKNLESKEQLKEIAKVQFFYANKSCFRVKQKGFSKEIP